MIDEIFANRVFEKFDQIEKKLDTTCDNVSNIKTDVEVLKTNFENHIAGQVQAKSDKKDSRNWLFGIVSFVFLAYIAVKEIS